MAETCSKTLFGGNNPWGGAKCGNKGKVQVHGKWFCHVHSPEGEAKRKAKRDASYTAYSAKIDRQIKHGEYQAACERAFHSPDGRKIATEDIAEGVVFQLRDALNQMQNWACKFENMLEYESLKDEKQFGKEHSEARALLSSLKVQGPET